MAYRNYPSPSPLLIGYDPYFDLPANHLARMVETVTEASMGPQRAPRFKGQPGYDPRLIVKVLIYAYALGVRSSRQMERLCEESLPFRFLTRGDTPSYKTLCTGRREYQSYIEQVWIGLFAVADDVGLHRLGKVVIDSTKVRANASYEAVIRKDEYASMRAELVRIMDEAARVDAQEDSEGAAAQTCLAVEVSADQMRDIIRRVRKQLSSQKRQERADALGKTEPALSKVEQMEVEPSSVVSVPNARMAQRIESAIVALDESIAEGRKHLCLTDPDARMMGEGREKSLRECHSLEVAVDAGLLVMAGTTQSSDNDRLVPILEEAKKSSPSGIVAVDADSGYFSARSVVPLLEAGVDLCIPDYLTAADLRRGNPVGTLRAERAGNITFTYDPEQDLYVCSAGKELRFTQERESKGQQVRYYRAVSSCTDCPQAKSCLRQKNAKHRNLVVSVNQQVLETDRARFATPEHRERYHHRADAVETIFGFTRSVLNFTRWLLRGVEGVACEASLMKSAYQLRKIQTARLNQSKQSRRISNAWLLT